MIETFERRAAADADDRGGGKLAGENRPHQLAIVLAHRRHDILEEHPAWRVKEKPGERQPLLFARRKHAIPSLAFVEPGDEPGKADPLQRRIDRRIVEAVRCGGIGDRAR